MKNLTLLGSALAAIVLAIGCTQKTIDAKVSLMKQTGGNVLVVSSSGTEALAYDGAKVKAEEYCFKQKKDFAMVKEESAYQGGDKTAAGIAGAVGSFFGKGSSSSKLDDYKVKMVFKCEGRYTGQGEPFAKTLDLSRTTRGW